jgi:hypothetical protein
MMKKRPLQDDLFGTGKPSIQFPTAAQAYLTKLL